MRRAEILDGRHIASELARKIRDEVSALRKYHRRVPGLAVVLVGDDPASAVYVRNKTLQCEETGIRSFVHRLPADVREEDLLTLIAGLNRDDRVNGILVQLPLPDQISAGAVIGAVAPEKDVDGFHVANVGGLASGADDAIVPCTPLGCLTLIRHCRQQLAGLKATVLGRSNIVGKPMALLLLRESCTVTVAHSRTVDPAGECRDADILVAAVGRPHLVRGDWIKPGAIVIDVGINRVAQADGKSRLTGDVDFQEAIAVAGWVTPVPGGVGPMTVACLMRNTLIATHRQLGLDLPDV
jgi:methylenetetrahydrofolate dehydrogenase (NADP+)/methenyltetrahydrofolate cyclohydrolase